MDLYDITIGLLRLEATEKFIELYNQDNNTNYAGESF